MRTKSVISAIVVVALLGCGGNDEGRTAATPTVTPTPTVDIGTELESVTVDNAERERVLDGQGAEAYIAKSGERTVVRGGTFPDGVASVVIERRAGAGFMRVASTTTLNDGSFRIPLVAYQDGSNQFRLTFRGETGGRARVLIYFDR